MVYYNSLNAYLRKRFGEKVYKIALDGGFTCPNRDGTVGRGGCIFCLDGSSGFAIPCADDINSAIDDAVSVLGGKARGRYIAYFQSYTNTYAPAEKLERLFMGAAARDDIVAISVGTRPDCLGDEVIDILRRVNAIKPVFVELGLQTIHEKTAEYIRRGYALEVFDEAMRKLNESGLETVVHMIIGLPGENTEMMMQTASYIARSGARGIKFQLLHVLEGTDLADDYRKGLVKVLSMEEYIEALKCCVEAAGPDIIVHRLTGDGAKKDLIAPMWSADKKRVLNAIGREIAPFEQA